MLQNFNRKIIMKLKEHTFAVIAEKQGSISHEWFKKNCSNKILTPSLDTTIRFEIKLIYFEQKFFFLGLLKKYNLHLNMFVLFQLDNIQMVNLLVYHQMKLLILHIGEK